MRKSNSIDPAQKVATFKVKQKYRMNLKVNYVEIRAWEFTTKCGKREI